LKAGSPVTKQSYLYQKSAEGKSGTLSLLVKETIMKDSFFKIHEKKEPVQVQLSHKSAHKDRITVA